MQQHVERPNTHLDRILCTCGIVVSLGIADWLVLGIREDVDNTQPWRFFALAGALVLAFLLAWVLLAHVRVRYQWTGEALSVQRVIGRLHIPLQDILHLYRWRQRWAWSGGARSELGVEEVILLPNTLLRTRHVWVVVYQTAKGERRAVGLLPSAQLLAMLKAWAWEHRGTAG